MTPQTPPTDRPLTAGDVRYVEGHLDMTHAPSLGAFIGKSLASHVSGNRMPAMSGDNRERIPAHIRERFDRDCESTAQYILDHLSRPATSAASEGAVDRVMAVLNHWFDGRARIDRNSDMVAQLAALASPPVSERERELEGALQEAVEFIDGLGAELLNERTADWYPEGANNAASHMSEAMRLAGNRCADYQALTAQPQEPV